MGTIVTNGVALILGLCGSVVLARTLSMNGRGEVARGLAFIGIITSVPFLGIGAAVTVLVARREHDGADIALAARAIAARRFQIGVGLALGGVLLLHSSIAVRVAWLVACLTTLASSSLQSVVLAQYQGELRFMKWNRIRLIQPIMYALLLIAALPIMATPSAAFLVVAAAMLPVVIVLRRGLRLQVRNGQTSTPESRMAVLKFSRSVWIASAATMVNGSLDLYYFAAVGKSRALAVYAVATGSAGLILPVATALASVLLPSVASEDRSSGARPVRLLIAYMGVSTLVAVAAAIGIHYCLPLFYGERYRSAVVVAELLSCSVWGLAVLLGVCEYAKGLAKPGIASTLQGIGAATTAGLLATARLPLDPTAVASRTMLGSLAAAIAALVWVARSMSASEST